MALVVLIVNPEDMDEYAESDMYRWWRHQAKRHIKGEELYYEVASPVKFNVYEGIKRLKSFGIIARAAYRPTY